MYGGTPKKFKHKGSYAVVKYRQNAAEAPDKIKKTKVVNIHGGTPKKMQATKVPTQ